MSDNDKLLELLPEMELVSDGVIDEIAKAVAKYNVMVNVSVSFTPFEELDDE
jgi:hypothetical protein